VPSINLKVSGNGNGVGQIIFYGTSQNKSSMITLDIHPKLWNPNPETRVLDLLIDELQKELPQQLNCYEGQTIRIFSTETEYLNRLVAQLTKLDAEIGTEVDDGNLSNLFTIVGTAYGESSPITAIEQPRSSIWELLSTLDEASQEMIAALIKIPNYEDKQIDLISWSKSMLRHKAVELILARLFLQKLEKATHLLKPRFVERDIEETRFRGRVNILSLRLYSKRIRQNFVSSVSEMSNDNSGNQLILGALTKLSKTTLDSPPFASRIMRLSKFFTGVSKQSDSELIALAKSFQHKRSMVGYGELVFLSKMIILGLQPGIGDAKQTTNFGLATGMYLSSARLWEILLSNRSVGGKWTIAPFKKPLPLRAKDSITGLFQKEPDLCIRDNLGNVIAVVDAKYKILDSSVQLGKMPNGDQYQQYAYSAASGLPSLFIYSSSKDEFLLDCDKIIVSQSNLATGIGVMTIPFPKDSDLASWWNEVEPKILEAITEIIEL
jgi:5-methylcytosine-specific restriction endonuclease McrBC regulatory subunit McrC